MKLKIKNTIWVCIQKTEKQRLMYATYSNHYQWEYDYLPCDGNLMKRLEEYKAFKWRCEVKSRVPGSPQGLQKLRLEKLGFEELFKKNI